MAKKKRNTKKNIPMSPQRKAKKRRVAIARLKLLTFLLVVSGSVFGIYKYNTTVERPPLSMDVAGYVQNTTYNPETDEVMTDEDGNIISNADLFEEDAIAVFQPSIPAQMPSDMDMEIYSPYALVFDATTNEMLFAKDADVKVYPASTTKILTAAVVLDNAPSGFEFVAGDELDFVNAGSSLAYINKGNVLDTEMIIDGLMLPSGNDAAYVAAANIGRAIKGDESLSAKEAVDTFVLAMNSTAKKIGATNTHFTNPDGFHDDNHYTTLLDMLKITLYAKEMPVLAESVKKESRYCTFLSGEAVSWENSNKLLHEYSDCYYMYANGFKTGMTDESGYCVVATATRFGHEIVCMVYGSTASDVRWNDTLALMDRAFVHIKKSDD